MSQSNTDRLAKESERPQSVSIPGLATTRHSLRDQIEMDEYLARKKAAKKRLGGIKLVRTSPPSMD